jgi:hypothetical protein
MNDILNQLHDEFRHLGRSVDSERTCCEFRARHPEVALDGVTDLFELVRALDLRGGRSVEERAAIVTALLIDADNPLLRRALFETLLAGLVSTCRSLRFGHGVYDDPGEFVHLACVSLSEILVEWAGQSRRFAAPDVLSALRGRLRRQLLGEKHHVWRFSPITPSNEPAGDESTLFRDLLMMMDGPDARHARNVYERLVMHTSFRDLATKNLTTIARLHHEMEQFVRRALL